MIIQHLIAQSTIDHLSPRRSQKSRKEWAQTCIQFLVEVCPRQNKGDCPARIFVGSMNMMHKMQGMGSGDKKQ